MTIPTTALREALFNKKQATFSLMTQAIENAEHISEKCHCPFSFSVSTRKMSLPMFVAQHP